MNSKISGREQSIRGPGSGKMQWTAGKKGFTLLELLVVSALLAAFALFVLPTHPDDRNRALSVACLNNSKQLALGWMLYADDNEGTLPSNRPYVGTLGISSNNWARGLMDWSANPQNTNQSLLLSALLGPYLKCAAVYHCPADVSTSAAGLRIRSYSMNGFVGVGGSGPTVPGWKQFLTRSDFSKPSGIFVFLEEHPNSLDDGYFVNDPGNTNAWLDLPASSHRGRAGSFSFADGHAELHNWQESSTRSPVISNAARPFVSVGDAGGDLEWVLQRTTQR